MYSTRLEHLRPVFRLALFAIRIVVILVLVGSLRPRLLRLIHGEVRERLFPLLPLGSEKNRKKGSTIDKDGVSRASPAEHQVRHNTSNEVRIHIISHIPLYRG